MAILQHGVEDSIINSVLGLQESCNLPMETGFGEWREGKLTCGRPEYKIMESM